ncbi:MAG: methionine synthase, partial [Gammaproteobacteria bacterium]|nr:methionine synthase [Gammaproteobacteria bacterium]
LSQLVPRIDWSPFFQTWELKGMYPKIFEHPEYGEEARRLFEDAQQLLARVLAEKRLKAQGVIGLFPANSVGDDIEIYTNESRHTVLTTLCNLRQQSEHPNDTPYLCLSDFIAPKTSGIADYIGGFAVTAGDGIESYLQEFAEDDYQDILIKALADRLAEAFAEHLHERVRKEFWGYAPDESFSNEEIIKGRYQGIRPAYGYPACPDHTEKWTLWSLLAVEKNTGIRLTEHLAMLPTASVSGIYYAHPKARYFGVGKIDQDQVRDYAKRKKMALDDMQKWLGSNLF